MPSIIYAGLIKLYLIALSWGCSSCGRVQQQHKIWLFCLGLCSLSANCAPVVAAPMTTSSLKIWLVCPWPGWWQEEQQWWWCVMLTLALPDPLALAFKVTWWCLLGDLDLDLDLELDLDPILELLSAAGVPAKVTKEAEGVGWLSISAK